LIKLASRFKNLYHTILKQYKIKVKVEKTEEYIELKNDFEESLKNAYDHSFFVAKLGETFVVEEKEID
jgi:hypothetical protein